MNYPISVRLWLSNARSNETEEVANHRKLLKPELDKKSGKYYVQINGHDAFAAAGMVPSGLIQLITVRQEINADALTRNSRDPGVYMHEGVEIVLEYGFAFQRELFITGSDIAKLQQAYHLFREGKLTMRSWTSRQS